MWYIGTDSDNALPFPQSMDFSTTNFYIGRIGGEIEANLQYFDSTVVGKIPSHNIFGYWDFGGPGNVKSNPKVWGAAQGAAAVKAAANATAQMEGKTLFLDTEPGNGGWQTSTTPDEVEDNRMLLNACLEAITAGGYIPGIYISYENWDLWFGADFIVGQPFVFWVAGTDCPATLADAIAQFPTASRGGVKPMLWQTYVPGCGSITQDINITPYGGFLQGIWRPTLEKPANIAPVKTNIPVAKAAWTSLGKAMGWLS